MLQRQTNQPEKKIKFFTNIKPENRNRFFPKFCNIKRNRKKLQSI